MARKAAAAPKGGKKAAKAGKGGAKAGGSKSTAA